MKRILYVDDEDINLKLFELSFQNAFQVVVALSAEEGLRILDAGADFDLLVSDLRMPGMNGLDFIKKVKSEKRSLTCMLLTGYVESEVILEGFNKDLIYRYITKPWKKEELLAVINEALEK